MYFSGGLISIFSNGNIWYVLAVRAGHGAAGATPVDNGVGTVTDTSTGLMWQKSTAPGTYNCGQALAYAHGLMLAGYSDWRLPNLNELQTLVDYSRYNPATDIFLPKTRCRLTTGH